jgi:hypothetical protein
MKSLVAIHHERPPHPLIADVEAFSVDRVLSRAGRGPFAFDAPMESMHRHVLQHGRIVVITSTAGALPYVGVIKHTEQDAASGTVEISGDNYTSVLYGLGLPRTARVENRGAGRIAEQLLQEGQGMGHSVFIRSAATTGARLTSTFDFGSQTLGQALDGLAKRTGDEWWLEHIVERNRIAHVLRWERSRGVTRRDTILQEGTHFAAASYKTDALGTVRTVTAIGGGGPLAGRTSVAVGQLPGQASGMAGQVQTLSLTGTAAPPVSPLIARDVIAYRPLDTSATVLADVARRALERPAIAAERMAFTLVSSVWSRLYPGDWIRARWHSLNYGGLDRWIRVSAMQPDEDGGTCVVAVEQTV